MPREPAGSIKPGKGAFKGLWLVRARFANVRRWVPLPNSHGLSRAQATVRAKAFCKKCRNVEIPKRKITLNPQHVGAESVRAYAGRWTDDRERRGLTSVGDDRSRLENHIFPLLGEFPMVAVTADDIEDVRDRLDAKIITGELSWKTASNVWTVITSMFKDARWSKNRALRVRNDNPAADVRGPERGTHKGKQYLYPSEFVTLLESPRVPAHWKRVFALTVYLYLRAGELEVLEWSDVDLDHLVVTVSRSLQADGTVGPPKNGKPRRVPIDEQLAPLLTAMHAEAKGAAPAAKGLVIHVPRKSDRANVFREYLVKAGVTRLALHAATATHTPITFHDLRATGITWCAVRGDDPLRIMQRAGHQQFSTTQGYIREADEVREHFGVPFPPIPSNAYGPLFGTVLERLADDAGN